MNSVLNLTVRSRQASRAFRAGALASLLAVLAPAAAFAADGFANVNGTTTGGAGGSSVTVTDLASLTAAIGDDTPRIVNVSGTINLGSSNVRFGSNKTIQGVGTNSGFIGDLKGVSVNNVIIQRLNFTNKSSVGDGDGLTLQVCTHVWVDHCSFVDCGDGSLDLTHACDYCTVSWCKFSYTVNSGHNFVNLIGHSDSNASEDTGHLRITMHHNWYSTLCIERMPRVRYGQVHVYNNYYGGSGSNYNVGIGNGCQVLLENCYFDSQTMPWKNYSSSTEQGKIHWNSGNVFVNTTVPTWAPNSTVFTPPYSYSLESGSTVKSSVTAGAGSGGTGGGGGGGGGGTTTTLQAESATLGGGAFTESTNGGFNGSGYVNFPTTGGSLQFSSVNGGSTSGSRTIAIRFANGTTSSRTGRILINGVAQNITFASTGAWTTWNTQNITVTLNAGTTNTIRFESTGQDLGNIDQIAVTTP